MSISGAGMVLGAGPFSGEWACSAPSRSGKINGTRPSRSISVLLKKKQAGTSVLLQRGTGKTNALFDIDRSVEKTVNN